MACFDGHLASVKYLVSQGADPMAKEKFGEDCPRSMAVRYNHTAIVAFFGEHGRARGGHGGARGVRVEAKANVRNSSAEDAVRTAMMNLSGDNKQKALADGTWGTLSWEERLRRLEGLGLITSAQSV